MSGASNRPQIVVSRAVKNAAKAIAIFLVVGAVAWADFTLSDQGSGVYYHFAVVAGEHVQLEKDAEISGHLHSNATVLLKKDSRVEGDVSASGEITNQGTVTGEVTPGADPLELPALLAEAELRALADRVFEEDVTFTDAVVDDVVFVDGTVRIRGSVNGVGTVVATRDILLDTVEAGFSDPERPGGKINPPERSEIFVLDEETRLSLIALGDVRVSKDRPFCGAVRAGRDVTLEKGVSFAGVIVAERRVHVKTGSTVTFLDFDEASPDLTVISPADGSQLTASPATIELAYADADSGVDPGSLRVFLDDLDLTGSCDAGAETAACLIFQLPVGAHRIVAKVRDLAGNVATATADFTLAFPGAAPVIEITAPEPGSLTNAEAVTVEGRVLTTGTVVELSVNGLPVVLAGIGFQVEVPIVEGPFVIAVRAVDDEGRETIEQTEIEVDRTPPELVVEEPTDPSFSNVGEVRLRGTAEDGLGPVEVMVQGTSVEVDVVGFETTVDLAEGGNAITVTAVDRVGNEVTRVIGVTYEPTLGVTITEPADQSQATTDTVTVRGTVAGDPVEVTVAGLPAELHANAFTTEVPLVLGSNPIAVLARDAGGRRGKAVVTVLRDTSPPRIVFTTPSDGQVVFEPTVDVAGLVNDVVGTASPAGERFTVTVNGQPARVEGDTFLLAGVGLQPGANSLTATVVDDSGNLGETSVSVRFEEPVAPRLLRISGSGQAAILGTQLAAPLVARTVDETGQAVAGAPVLFRVTEGDGELGGGERQVVVFSDSEGLAAVGFTVGARAGLGNHVVEAVAVGFTGTVRFLLDALPGAAQNLVVDTGTHQLGVTGRRLPEPFVAIAVDAAFNPLPGLPVTFQVVAGGGQFENGLDSLEVVTDAQGQASATLILGPQEGESNNAVLARLDSTDPDPPVAAFVASAMAAGSGPTSIRGVILDNTDQPVPGVTVRIRGTAVESTAGATGTFLLEDVPNGTVHLEVDGGTATRPGHWPHLEFVRQVIPGRENELLRPIYLLPLETEGIFVSETEGGTLTLPALPGFELEVAPGSATFPDGSRSGVVSVTVVHSDKVPMIPSYFQQPRLVITVQPTGTLFEPPARLTLPNLDGRRPGEVVDFFSFDHDLARFVSIGPAQVTEDGTAIRSKPGFGIVEGGWHCGDNPSGTGTSHKCPECDRCNPRTKLCEHLDECRGCGEPGDGDVCDGSGHCVVGVTMLPKICDQIGLDESGLQDITRDELPERWKCSTDECFVGKKVTFNRVTHQCDGIDLKGATYKEEPFQRTGGDCTFNLEINTGPGGMVIKGNRLKSFKESREPGDILSLCGSPNFRLDEGSCSIVFMQTIKVGPCVAQTNTITYTIGGGCENWDIQRN